MAKEDDKATMNADGSGNEQNQPAKKKGGAKKLILFGGIGFGAVVVGIVIALFVIKPMMSESGHEDQSGSAEVASTGHGTTDAHADESSSSKSDQKKQKSGNGEAQSHICAVKDIVINPAGTGGSRYLSASLSFEFETAAAAALFKEREPIIRDALITILSSKTVAQLTDTKQKEIARYQIKKRVARLMKTDELSGVYYTDFVLQ